MALQDILDNPDSDWVYTVYARPRIDASTVAKIGFSRGRVADPTFGETTVQFPGFLKQALNVETNIDALDLGSTNDASFGVIEIAWNPDGEATYDYLAGYSWSKRDVTVQLGYAGTPWLTEFYPVFTGKSRAIVYDERTLTIILRDPALALDEPLQQNRYLGNGTQYEGGTNLTDVWKPIAFGAPRNLTPILLDDPAGTQYWIYQWHDGVVKAVDNVYDGGNPLTATNGGANDITDLALAQLEDWSPPSPTGTEGYHYATDNANGLIRIGFPPTGPEYGVTMDGQGDNDDPDVTYPVTAAQIARRIAKKHAGLTSLQLLASTFTDLDTDASYPLSFYSGDQEVTCKEAMDAALASVGGYRFFDRDGKLNVGQLRFRTSGRTIAYSSDEDASHIKSLRLLDSLPTWHVRVGYKRMWTVQGVLDLAPAASDAYAAERTRAFRGFGIGDAAVKAVYEGARNISDDTLIDAQADAITEATRRKNLLTTKFRIFEADCRREQFQNKPGDTVTIDHPRYGFSGGVDAVVLGVAETTNTRSTVLRLLV